MGREPPFQNAPSGLLIRHSPAKSRPNDVARILREREREQQIQAYNDAQAKTADDKGNITNFLDQFDWSQPVILTAQQKADLQKLKNGDAEWS